LSDRVTIADLARESQVSVSTIDRILNGRSTVKPATVDHVLATAERIGFRGIGAIRSRRECETPVRNFGFLLNGRERNFYKGLAIRLNAELAAQPTFVGRCVIRHLDDLDAERAAAALMELGETCDAIGCITLDHPLINLAVDTLAARGVRVVSMLSDISADGRSGFIGANDWKLGRSAGWFIQRLSRTPGKVAIMLGSERYLCQQSQATSLRSYLESHAPQFKVVAMPASGEQDGQAEQIATAFLETAPDLAAIFVAGGGLEGVIRAIRRRQDASGGARRFLVIGTELTDATRGALAEGWLDMILAHPVDRVAAETVRNLVRMLDQSEAAPRLHRTVPFEVLIGENC